MAKKRKDFRCHMFKTPFLTITIQYKGHNLLKLSNKNRKMNPSLRNDLNYLRSFVPENRVQIEIDLQDEKLEIAKILIRKKTYVRLNLDVELILIFITSI